MAIFLAVYSYPQLKLLQSINIWDKVFKSGPSKICGRQPLKNLKGYCLLKQKISLQIISKAVFHKFYLVYSWILCPISHYRKLLVELTENSDFFVRSTLLRNFKFHGCFLSRFSKVSKSLQRTGWSDKQIGLYWNPTSFTG